MATKRSLATGKDPVVPEPDHAVPAPARSVLELNREPSRIIVPGNENVVVPSEKFQRLFDEAQAMEREDAWQSGEVGFLSRASVQVTLPYRAPKGAPPVWTRTSGNISLMIQPGYFTQQRAERASNGRQKIVSETVSLGYPYGSYPRLMLAWIGKEIMAKKKRGSSQAPWKTAVSRSAIRCQSSCTTSVFRWPRAGSAAP